MPQSRYKSLYDTSQRNPTTIFTDWCCTKGHSHLQSSTYLSIHLQCFSSLELYCTNIVKNNRLIMFYIMNLIILHNLCIVYVSFRSPKKPNQMSTRIVLRWFSYAYYSYKCFTCIELKYKNYWCSQYCEIMYIISHYWLHG